MLLGDKVPVGIRIFGGSAVVGGGAGTAATLGTPSRATSWRASAARLPAAAGCRIVYCLLTSSEDFSTSFS